MIFFIGFYFFEIKEKTVIVTVNYLQAYEIEVSTFIE